MSTDGYPWRWRLGAAGLMDPSYPLTQSTEQEKRRTRDTWMPRGQAMIELYAK